MKTTAQFSVGDLVRWVEVDDPKINRLRNLYGTGPFFVVSPVEKKEAGIFQVRVLVHCSDEYGRYKVVVLPVLISMMDRVETAPVELFESGDQVYFRELPDEMKYREFRNEEGRTLADLHGSGPFEVTATEWERSSHPDPVAHPQWVNLGSEFQISGFFLTKKKGKAKKASRPKISADRSLRGRGLRVSKRRPLGWWIWQTLACASVIACVSVGVWSGWILADLSHPGIYYAAGLWIISTTILSFIPAMFCWALCQGRAEQYEYYDYQFPE